MGKDMKGKTTPEEIPRVRKLSSSNPEARDEGPRLLPLIDEPRSHEPSVVTNSRYMDLADTAMRRKKPAPAHAKASNRKIRD
jgi:hypothetical protein